MAEPVIINASKDPTAMSMESPPVFGSTLFWGIVSRITPSLDGVLLTLPMFLLACALSSLSLCSALLRSLPMFLVA